MEKKLSEILESLSPLERKIIPLLNYSIEEIMEKSGLDKTSILRALSFLENKELLKMQTKTKKIIELNTNGIYYKKNHLPERNLIILLEKNNYLPLEEAKKLSGLSDNEFKVSLGVLKDKALASVSNGKLVLNAKKEELVKKTFEEQLIDSLPLELDKLTPEQKFALENLKKRKEIIQIEDKKEILFELTELGKKIAGQKIESEMIEEVTPEVIASWNKNKKFRKYNIQSKAPHLTGGKRHFVNQAIEYGKRIWLDMGFKEMTGSICESSFWVFDSLFTPQDHPAREMQDTFFIKDAKAKLLDKKLIEKVKEAHEKGVGGSKGWRYSWKEEEAKKVLLRTHTTCLSAQTLEKLRKLKDKRGKYFSIGRCFRNETLDWSHGFEFNQTEGIVIDPNGNFRNLFGYLKEFFTKMGFSEVKFVPSFFPYTEPSVEIYGYLKTKNTWIEIGGAGIFRPEVVIPLIGEYIPILAWVPGFDRILMDYYKIKDLRELYENDIKKLREKKIWIK